MLYLRSASVRRRALLIAAFAIATTTRSQRVINAQDQKWTPAYPLLMSGDRALAMVEAAEKRLDYVPGEVLVKFKDGVSAEAQQRALMSMRSRPAVSALRPLGDVAIYRDPTEPDATILAAQLSSQPEVEYAEPNYLRRWHTTPNDPGFSTLQWNLTALDMPRVWDINPGASASVVVAVVDTGITHVNQSFTFPTWNGRAVQNVSVAYRINADLTPSRLVNPRDFVFWDGPVLDMVGHGTHVSSTIGEDANNNLAEAGIAYNVKLMPVKVCFGYWELQFTLSANGFIGFAPQDIGGCPTDAVVQGIRYAADMGANVINLSLGGPQISTAEEDAVKYALGKGAFIAISAGNEFEQGNPIEYPSGLAPSLDGVMSVGAVGPSLRRAYYSNSGPQLEIAAPGGNDREGGASATIWQSTILESDSRPGSVVFPRFDRYAETPEEGTSMAAPHVCGVVALLFSQGVNNPAAIEALIRRTARDLGAPGRDDEYGYGLVQPRAALLGLGFGK